MGKCYIVKCANAYHPMYLAVELNLRNKNYGSKILSDLKGNFVNIKVKNKVKI